MLDELYEDEDFSPYESEFEDEFAYEDEWESYADEYSDPEGFDGEDLFGDFEGDEFWGRLKSWAKKGARKLLSVAKNNAGKIGSVIGGAFGGPAGAAVGGSIGRFVKNLEDEDESDTEDEMNAVMPMAASDEALAEAMADAASKAHPNDAQALGGAIAITITSRAPMAVKTVAPGIAAATGRLAKHFASSPSSKQLNKTLAGIVRDTTGALSRKAAKGKPVTNATAARVMTKQARRTLRSQPRLARALANNVAKKRKLNRAAIARAERFY
ncbi:hypothetical protein [Salipiger mangrovisoli]|uniref:Uncharacterized protein n=1 Tax=Salipiger mangrovisoli TaxID=2865933 RepID=A0ABR9X131_9RHOB|nr:hypothetical protein [Salipiger mangrovisoli]MBE9637269.1 hypothetical protein [Salipiger mangrovisoli]